MTGIQFSIKTFYSKNAKHKEKRVRKREVATLLKFKFKESFFVKFPNVKNWQLELATLNQTKFCLEAFFDGVYNVSVCLCVICVCMCVCVRVCLSVCDTECVTDLDSQREMIIFESILTTFEARFIF